LPLHFFKYTAAKSPNGRMARPHNESSEKFYFILFKYKELFTFSEYFIIIVMKLTVQREGYQLERMYRVLGFWTGIFAVMLYLGDMYTTSLIFFGQTGFFLLLSYLKLTERMYIYIFGAYLTVFFIGFSYWTNFMMIPGAAGH